MDSQVIEITPTPDTSLKKWLNTIQCVDCVEGMKMLPAESIDMVVTSPPYDGIRDYKGFSIDLSTVGVLVWRA